MQNKRLRHTSLDETEEKVVRLLKSHQSEYISGERLSVSLGLTRAAVWKTVKRLRALGYKISSRPRSGYKLVQKTHLMLPWEISDGLRTEMIGSKIYYHDTIDSTQSHALKLALKPHENGSIVIAQRQTQGRGRNRRRWSSPEGGIWLSILLRPSFDITYVSLFPMLVSLAVSVAIEKRLSMAPRVKWPNDVTLSGKKVAGILVDASIESNKIEYLVVGIGINFKINPRRIIREIRGINNYGAASLLDRKSKVDPVNFLQYFLFELEQMYNSLVSGNAEWIKKEWEKRSSTIGRVVSISTPAGRISGKALGIDNDGALLVSKKGRTYRLLVGDVDHES
ncbi:MAG: biotin--[acetyl-CoA-carboxylase] ligase [Thaumarchaeota archaeon]|nr:biotin--[acetyl-CoA-carboxylase] ligase [Nitrososphaerota archaeon]